MPFTPPTGWKSPASEKIGSSFKKLAAASDQLSAAAKELAEVIEVIDAAFRAVEPNVATWHEFARGGSENGYYWHRDIGFTKIDRRWGLALRSVEGHEAAERDDVESWRFKDAPHWMQIESFGKITELIDEIIERIHVTSKKLKDKAVEAQEVAAVLNQTLTELNLIKRDSKKAGQNK